MISYQKISRWLKKPLDPFTVEDWVANRETFGPPKEKDELEQAFLFEKTKENGFGIFEVGETLLVFPSGGGEVWIYGEKVEKIDLVPGKMLFKDIDPKRKIRIKVGKLEWSGEGKEKIIFDS